MTTPMTMSQKILARHAGLDHVDPGQIVQAQVDFAFTNDIMIPVVADAFERIGAGKVFDTERIGLFPDHFTPNKDIKSAHNSRLLREFAKKYGIRHYYEVGRVGIEHSFVVEQGLAAPGEIVIGSDSHTCTAGALGAFASGVGSTDLAAIMATGRIWLRVPETTKFVFHGRLGPWIGGKDLILHTIGKIGVDGANYQAMEFCGEALQDLGMAGRFTMCNMAIEAGAKTGLMPYDKVAEEYLSGGAARPFTPATADPDAPYAAVHEWDVSGLPPLVACPHLPENVRPVSQLTDVSLDQVVIGGCTNGCLEDLRVAASILKGRTIDPGVRCIILPGTQNIYRQAMRSGLMEIFVDAGAFVSGPTCGPCLGGHMGILDAGERALSTTNRNFVGRMGHPKSEVYLAGPAVAAASAVLGRIAHPSEVDISQKR
ncbi:3-isopropylmalate dehydratase large subunit [Desulfocurvus sp. DL9XJH121]